MPKDAVPFVCPNPKCLIALGFTTPTEIRIGAVVIKSRVVVTCRVCGGKKSWRPDHKGVAPPRRTG